MNIQKMMKQAQEMQSKMQQMQEDLEAKSYEGAAGGGMAKVTINGKGLMQKLSLDDSLIDVEEKEMLEDLIVAAYNDAKAKAEDATADEMGKLTGGLNLPAGMKLPF
jgi:DNA-binding YbaB/EbfC family protein